MQNPNHCRRSHDAPDEKAGTKFDQVLSYKQIRWTCNGLANLFLDPASADLWMMLLTVELQRLVFDLLTKQTMSMNENICCRSLFLLPPQCNG